MTGQLTGTDVLGPFGGGGRVCAISFYDKNVQNRRTSWGSF